MTKIEEFENRIIKNGITEGDFAEYERLLGEFRCYAVIFVLWTSDIVRRAVNGE